MIHKIVQYVLTLCGKNYTLDPQLPASYLIQFCAVKALWKTWSFIRLQTNAFVSPLSAIENAGNLSLGKNATLEDYVVINAVARNTIHIGERTKIGAYSHIIATPHLSKLGHGFTIGSDSGCGEFCYFGAVGGITIGNRVIMGQYVSFHAQEHEYKNPSQPIKEQGTTQKGIIVGDDCWIGAKATLLDGTITGKNCVIAAGAVVKGEFPDHSVIGGVPARILSDIKHAA